MQMAMNKLLICTIGCIGAGFGSLFFIPIINNNALTSNPTSRAIYLSLFIICYCVGVFGQYERKKYNSLQRIIYILILFAFCVFLSLFWIKYTSVEKVLITILIGIVLVNIRRFGSTASK